MQNFLKSAHHLFVFFLSSIFSLEQWCLNKLSPWRRIFALGLLFCSHPLAVKQRKKNKKHEFIKVTMAFQWKRSSRSFHTHIFSDMAWITAWCQALSPCVQPFPRPVNLRRAVAWKETEEPHLFLLCVPWTGLIFFSSRIYFPQFCFSRFARPQFFAWGHLRRLRL